ncbi:DUF1418 family protein [Salmonella enterica subsp. enterica serovar Copenhagen]|nr:DUF1418 family protein [Salmonella enterica subsp. enterica serovar Copenhagen]
MRTIGVLPKSVLILEYLGMILLALALLSLNHYPRFYVSTSKSIIKALINMHSFEIQLSPIG